MEDRSTEKNYAARTDLAVTSTNQADTANTGHGEDRKEADIRDTVPEVATGVVKSTVQESDELAAEKGHKAPVGETTTYDESIIAPLLTSTSNHPQVITPPPCHRPKKYAGQKVKSTVKLSEAKVTKKMPTQSSEFSLLSNFHMFRCTNPNPVDNAGLLDKPIDSVPKLSHLEQESQTVSGLSSKGSRSTDKDTGTADPSTLVHKNGITMAAGPGSKASGQQADLQSIRSSSVGGAPPGHQQMTPTSPKTIESPNEPTTLESLKSASTVAEALHNIVAAASSASPRTKGEGEYFGLENEPDTSESAVSLAVQRKMETASSASKDLAESFDECPSNSEKAHEAEAVQNGIKVESPRWAELQGENLSDLLQMVVHKQVKEDTTKERVESYDQTLSQDPRMATCATHSDVSIANSSSSRIISFHSKEGSVASHSAVRLRTRIKGWTGKKKQKKGDGRSKQNKAEPNALALPSIDGKPLNKARRRRKKSNLFRSLAKYVRSKPTLPVISEDPDQRDDETMEVNFKSVDEIKQRSLVEDIDSFSIASLSSGLETVSSQDYDEPEGDTFVEAGADLGANLEIVGSGDNEKQNKSNPQLLAPYLSSELGTETAACQGDEASKQDIDFKGIGSVVEIEAMQKSKKELESNKATAYQPNKTGSFTSRIEVSCDEPMLETTSQAKQSRKSRTKVKTRPSARDGLKLMLHPSHSSQDEETGLGVEMGTELTLEMLEMQRNKVHHTDIAVEEDGNCTTLEDFPDIKAAGGPNLKKLMHPQAEGDLESMIPIEPQRRCSRFSPTSEATKKGKKPVHERIFDFLDKKPTWVEMKGKPTITQSESQHAPLSPVSFQSDPGPAKKNTPSSVTIHKSPHFESSRRVHEKPSVEGAVLTKAPAEERKEKRSRPIFARLKVMNRALSGHQENREDSPPREKSETLDARQEPPADDRANSKADAYEQEDIAQYLPPAHELERWRSVEKRIDASLKKAEALANHYGDDIKDLFDRSASESFSSSESSHSIVSTLESASGEWSGSDAWQSVERKIDDSLSIVEKLAGRLGLSDRRLPTHYEY